MWEAEEVERFAGDETMGVPDAEDEELVRSFWFVDGIGR